MANKRMISKGISVSEQVNELSDFAALLFSWLIPHTDDYGVIPGTSKKIKALVMPMRKQTAEQVEAALKEIQSAGLIWRYIYKGTEYLQLCKFDEHQEGLHKRTTPKNPLYLEVLEDSENFREVPGNSRLIERKGKEQKGTAESDSRFIEFWNEYPKKVSKIDAVRAWGKLKPDDLLHARIMTALKAQKKSRDWLKDNGQFIPNAATWLNGKRWDDEISESNSPKKGGYDILD